MTMEYDADPDALADRWSFNGPYYTWMGFFHGLAFLTGKEVSAHEAFQGTFFHTALFGTGGALYAGLDNLEPAEAEARLSFCERAMNRLRRNETHYLLEKANQAKFAGLFLTCSIIVGAIAAIAYGVGSNRTVISACSVPCLFLPFIAGSVGKRCVQRLWDDKRARMASFVDCLPWARISTWKSD